MEAFKKLFHILDYYPVDLHPDEPKDYTCYCVSKNMTAPDSNFTTREWSWQTHLSKTAVCLT